MSRLRELKSRVLEHGVDGRIDEPEVEMLREALPSTGKLSSADVEALIEMRCEARSVCPEFDQLLFPALREQILADGAVSLVEQFHLLRMLYGGGGVDEAEKQFLRELRGELKRTSPEFDALCKQALEA